MTSTVEKAAFQAETKEILDLVIHSLYTHPAIFLRELISNASDALDKLRLETLRRTGTPIDDGLLRIRLEADPARRLFRVVDTGIGMSRQEVIDNIGTIARSGTRRFLEALRESGEAPAAAPELIGQFGVGFYSSFIVADLVTLETRRAGEPGATRWTSDGKGEYTIEEIERAAPGTTVTLHLRSPEPGDEDFQDFTQEAVLRDVVKRYSDFIEYPVEMEVGEGDGRRLAVLNSRKPLWTRPKDEIAESEHSEFYRHLTHDWHDPLETIHFRAEGALEYTALLYVPKERPLDVFDPHRAASRVQLYVKRVFVMANCEDLVPPWLRFVPGVVDSADLPLNISRETLQHNRQMGQIRKRLTTKVIETLAARRDAKRADYREFWRSFGPVVKEGIYYDDEKRTAIAELALFASTAGEADTTLAEYVGRMPVKQKEIYVLLAPALETARRSPHLEAYRARGYEVLFLTDPVDEFVLQRLTEYGGRRIRQIDKGEADLDAEGEEAKRAARATELAPLFESIRKELADHVESVRSSARLTESPACLVSGEHDLSPQMRRLLSEGGRDLPAPKRILELNVAHPLVERLRALNENDADHARFADCCELLLGQALVAEGSPPPNPARFARLVVALLAGE
ncbi:MAG: molecular chaperone HtpG [Planctomycetota bacterium]